MADSLKLEVDTPKGNALTADVDEVQAPSVNGEFGVMAGHRPVLAALQSGVLHYIKGGKERYAAVGPGFIEADSKSVRLLTDLFATPKDIDVDQATKDLAEATAKLAQFGERFEGPVYNELQRNVDWAQARLDTHAVANR